MPAGTIVDEMAELLCSNLQKDDLAAINASLSAEGATVATKEALLKVSFKLVQASLSLFPPHCNFADDWARGKPRL